MVSIVGLTGGIASGKSTVSYILKELGATIIDADKIARKVTQKGEPALVKIEEYFGKGVLHGNGELNRKQLGSIVFNNQSYLKKLNEITHPYIIKEIVNEINWNKQTLANRVIILDAALLIEMNLMDLVDEVWLVYVPEEIQITRLMKREGINFNDAKKRIDTQMPFEYKKQYAHRIIDNSKDIDYLRSQVEENWKRVVK